MKAIALFSFVLFTATAYSQSTLNNYKYVMVPERFSFSREPNQYGLTTISKLLLEEKGFTAFVGDGKAPSEVAANKCNALTAEVTEKKAVFVTNLTLLLKDCQGNIIFKSKEGKSREKEYPAAYNEALRNAFASLKETPYQYDSTILPTSVQQAVTTPASAAPVATTPVSSAAPTVVTGITGTLYAQAIPNGYQLVDITPKKVLILLKTSVQDYFIAEGGVSNGIVFKKEGAWIFEYYKDNKLVSQKLEIRF